MRGKLRKALIAVAVAAAVVIALFPGATRYEILAIDRNGHVIDEPPGWLRKMVEQLPDTDYTDAAEFLERPALWPMALMQFFKSPDGWVSWGNGTSIYFDNEGEKILESEHMMGSPFSDGLAAIAIDAEMSGNTMPSGYINSSGEIVVRGDHIGGFPFNDGRARIYQNNRYGYIDKAGEVVIPAIYNTAGDFSKGMAPVAWMDGDKYRVAYINPDGEVVLEMESGKYSSPGTFHDDLASMGVSLRAPKTLYGFIDRSGEFVIEAKYERVKDFTEGLAAVAINVDRDHYQDEDGMDVYSLGLAGDWGYIDTEGKEVIPLQFTEEIKPFQNGVAVVTKVGWLPTAAVLIWGLKMKLGLI